MLILGDNGSGKTTIGRELARLLNCAHYDAEEYHWRNTEMPYTVSYSHEERQKRLMTDMEKDGTFIMSGDIYNWGDHFKELFTYAVFLEVPTEIRIERIEKRQSERFGDRVKKGGDMYGQHLEFIDFAANRCIEEIKQSAFRYQCPILWIDGAKPVEEITDKIISSIGLTKG